MQKGKNKTQPKKTQVLPNGYVREYNPDGGWVTKKPKYYSNVNYYYMST